MGGRAAAGFHPHHTADFAPKQRRAPAVFGASALEQ